MAEKGKSRGAGAKSKQDKSRTSKKASPKTPRQTPTQPTPSPDGPREPLDVGPILDDLLDRVVTESARAAVARQLVPFTVSRARDAIVFVAEWRFLVRDEGDPDREGDPDPERDGVWSEDEEPQTCPWDSWTPGVVPEADASLPSEEISSEDLPVTAEAEGPLVCPGEVPDAAPDLAALLPPGQAQDLGTDTVVPVPGPPSSEPPIAPRPPRRGREPGRASRRGSIVTQPTRSSSRPSRPPRPRRAPLDAPRPRAAPPAAPPELPAQAPLVSHEGTAKVGDQVPPPPPSSPPSLASIQPRRPSQGTGVPRLGGRRGATRWVVPEVKVVDVSIEPEWARSGASRARLVPSGSPQVIPGAVRAPKAEPQLCDPWLVSARLAPGVTVRWGRSERRGPALAGHGGDEEVDEAVKRAEKDLKPILAYPECRLSEYGD